jgi:DNA polymerase-1
MARNPFSDLPGSDRPTLILIDASSYVYRAYHAVPHLSTKQGIPTNAVHGFTNMVLKALREAAPTHLALVFDAPGETFRSEIDANYKANRPAAPGDLVPQFGLVREVVRALNLPLVEERGVEADDVIATLGSRALAEGFRVVVVTGDKDFMQLVGSDLVLFDSMRDRWTVAKDVEERLGVRPDQVVDLMALCGDEIDNVPGVPGIGPKTAAQLIAQFGSLEGLLAHVGEVARPKLREALEGRVESIRRARRLVELKRDVPLAVTFDSLRLTPPDPKPLRELFERLEFTRLLRDLPVEPSGASQVLASNRDGPSAALSSPRMLSGAAEVADAVAFLRANAPVGLHASLGFSAPPSPNPLGLALAAGMEGGIRAFYLPLEAEGTREALATWARPVVELLEDARVAKVGFGLKRVWTSLRSVGVPTSGLEFDAELACYLLDPGRRAYLLPDVARSRLALELPAIEGRGTRAGPGEIPAIAAFAAAAAAEAALRLTPGLRSDLESEKLATLFDELEMPLLPVLAEMEWAGVRVDLAALADLGSEVERTLESLTSRLYELAGHPFNVASNRQLAQVLFEELKLPVIRRTKTGPSTDQDVLEKLADKHPLPQTVLEIRTLAKLKSTYLDALPQLVDRRDQRIHTTFNQATAATGRLSSSDPNLQNIPTRSELGQRIRKAFIAEPGFVLISADYSQIELRVLAHVSADSALAAAFAGDQDVHTQTAAEVFGVPLDGVTAEMRRAAKAINYGIAYGQSAFGLSQRLELPGAEAQAIIDRYFQRFRGVRRWLDETITSARKEGSVSTLFGRRRLLPDILSRNAAVRQASERMAVNTPIQGTAADLIKRAMLEVGRRLHGGRLRARLLLQVHDELVFEALEAEAEQVQRLATEAMEGAGSLSVPLKVVVAVGPSWADVH